MNELLAGLMRARSTPVGEVVQWLGALLVVLWALHRERLRGAAARGADLLVWGGCALVTVLALREVVGQVRAPRPWDFPTFHTVAVAAARGLDFYDPAVLRAVQTEVTRATAVSAEWLSEVGYWYLPPSALLLLPLGFLGLHAAMAVHLAVQTLWLALAVVLLQRTVPLRAGATGVAALVLLALLFQPVRATYDVAQIVFGCLFGAVLGQACLPRSAAAAALGLAFGFLSKHLLLVPMLFLAASRVPRERRAGLLAVAGVGLLTAASVAVFSPEVAAGFLTHGAGARSPELARDGVVQSLLALLYRGLDVTPRGGLLQVIAWPPFVIPAAVLTALTQWLSWRRPAAARERGALVLSLTLLCYPNTLVSTLALLLPVVLVVLHAAAARGWPAATRLAFVGVVFALPGLWPAGGGWAALVCWAACAALLAAGPDAPRARGPMAPGPALTT